VGPKSVVGGSLLRNDVVVYEGIKLFVEGKLEPKVYNWGVGEGVVDWVWNPELKDDYGDLVDIMDQAMAELRAGEVEAPAME
jgi:basic membrane lipoprotein Med (substrate-binding protein (PBP1-ABC) superfamily)